jgi:hypothetical protein
MENRQIHESEPPIREASGLPQTLDWGDPKNNAPFLLHVVVRQAPAETACGRALPIRRNRPQAQSDIGIVKRHQNLI